MYIYVAAIEQDANVILLAHRTEKGLHKDLVEWVQSNGNSFCTTWEDADEWFNSRWDEVGLVVDKVFLGG